ncbi:hypothetical protein GA0074695_5828 [Micromonospora viridifaciens]|uniref:Uncharacterized protein n=1 Tax=Micromonospora viridifaciens TaxID=1881 RepID=A0A1C4ZMS5_MICVI|nr:hypothetical protein [Micromonospora viridifaciens]SCF34238.1 hypothetical protein GA0074695_5828 [Micromonospora viridifaciens]
MSRSEFRFVVDGVELTAEQESLISREIQKAGLAALTTANAKLTNPLTLGHDIIELRPEWRGLWLIDGPYARELGERINDFAFWIKR